MVAGLDSHFSLRPKNWRQFPRNLKEYLWTGLGAVPPCSVFYRIELIVCDHFGWRRA